MTGDDLVAVEQRSGRARLVVALASLLLLAAAVALLADRLMMPGAFDISEIRVIGAAGRVDGGEVRRRIAERVSGNFFSVDLDEVERVVRAMPWVAGVRVRRVWPTALEVIVDEALPVVRWNDDTWLDQRGAPIAVADDPALAALPRLKGPAGARDEVLDHYFRFARLLDGEGLRVTGVRLGLRGSWTLTVATAAAGGGESTFELVAGRHEVEARVRRFAAVSRGSPLEGLARVAAVDLRYPSGFAVRWKSDAETDSTAAAGAGERRRQDS